MKRTLRQILFIVLILIMLPISKSSADSSSKPWGYYTFSFPEGYECDDYISNNLYAENDGSMFVIQLMDLSTMGLPASTDLLGEETVLETLAVLCVEGFNGTFSIYDKGTKNDAAYEIATVTFTENGSNINLTAIWFLKKNMMIYGIIYDNSLQHGKQIANEFMKNITVHDQFQEDDGPSLEWQIQKEKAENVITLKIYNKTCIVRIPDSYEIYFPGMGDNSPIPKFLGYTADEMDQFITQLQNTKVYVYALDLDAPTEIRISISDENGKLADADSSGNFSESIIKNFYDGTAVTQGEYEKIKIGDTNYFLFPNYSNGYKVRCFKGTCEISVRVVTLDNTYTQQQKQDALTIAQSMVVQ